MKLQDWKLTTYAHLSFKVRRNGSLVTLTVNASDVLSVARDLADFADAEYIGITCPEHEPSNMWRPESFSWSWHGYDLPYYHNEGIGCGRMGVTV